MKSLPKDFQQIADSAINHIGTLIDNTDVPEVLDVAIYSGLAYLSYNLLAKDESPLKIKLSSALYGPIALKLATTSSSGGGLEVKILGSGVTIPVNSQSVGLFMLGTLGVVAGLDWLGNYRKAIEVKETEGQYNKIRGYESPTVPESVLREIARLKSESVIATMIGEFKRGEELAIQAENLSNSYGIPYP